MLESFLHLIGIDAAGADRVVLHWRYPAWLIAGLVLLPVAAWFVIRRQSVSLPHLSVKGRGLLGLCRVGVLLLLVMVLGGPYVRMETRGRKPVVIVLMDESASMTMKAGPFAAKEAERATPRAAALDELSRAELMDRVIAEHRESLLNPLEEAFELRGYRFAQTVRSAPLYRVAADNQSAAEEETSLGGALERAMADAQGRAIAGILLFSDGRWTAGPDPMLVMRPRAGGRATPVFAVPVGSSATTPDIAMLDVTGPRTIAKGDTASITATVSASGFNGKAAVVRLFEGERELDQATVTLREGEPQTAQLTLRESDEAGPRLLRIAVDRADGERVTKNNAQTLAVSIDAQKLRVLYLESAPRWDYRFLDHAMRRDKGIEAEVVMESQLAAAAGTPKDLAEMAKLPVDAAGFAAYSVVILGDISQDLLPVRAQKALAAAVKEQGVGLIVQAGTQSMPQRMSGALKDLLPVRVADAAARGAAEREEALAMDGIEAEAFAPFHMRVTAVGSMHPAFQLYDSATRSRSAWNAMPDFHWAAATEESAPAATVLAEIVVDEKARPLIAEHFAGRGRVCFIGTDSTYLWRRNIGDAMFYRFWGQAIRHVAMKPQRSGNAGWMEAQPQRAAPGEPVTIEMCAVDTGGRARGEATLRVGVTRDGGEAETVAMANIGQPGRYRGVFVPAAAGAYTLSFGGENTAISTGFFVAASGREWLRPGVDRHFMSNLADATGGAMLELDELPRLKELLPRAETPAAPPVEVDVWDNWLTLALIIGCYGIDVGVRRMAGAA